MWSHLHAKESYYTRGALRHVVGDLQMNEVLVREELTAMDFWSSMIENWADANKEFQRCDSSNPNKCLLKMSKYLFRSFDAINRVFNIAKENKFGFEIIESSNYDILKLHKKNKMWVDVFKKSNLDIPCVEVVEFLHLIKCNEYKCLRENLFLAKIQTIVRTAHQMMLRLNKHYENWPVYIGKDQYKKPHRGWLN